MYPNAFYRVSVKALIRDKQGNVLVVKENQDTWSLPGGGLDHGESPEDGLWRELHEELGLEHIKIRGIYRTLTFELKQKQAWLMWVVYDVETDCNDFIPGDGVSEVQYLDPRVLIDSPDIFEQQVYKLAVQ